MIQGFVPPAYPHDRLDDVIAAANRHEGGGIDLSIGTPCDDAPAEVVAALSAGGAYRGYPPSIGTPALRKAVSEWFDRRLGATVDPATEIGACVGTKEFVASVPQYLKLRDPGRDTILYPEISYPTYAMGATLAGCRAVAYATLAEIDPADAARALAVWINSPSNPTGELADLDEAAAWGRAHDVPVLSDECYAEFTYAAPPTTILRNGTAGLIAVHSLSKRDNFAGARIGFYSGDPALVHYLREVRKHAGLMPPGPVQQAAVIALSDDAHVEAQSARYLHRMERLVEILAACDLKAELPAGTFYLWVRVPDGDSWGAARMLADRAGIVSAPGEFYGEKSSEFLRFAVVQPDELLELAARRVGIGSR